MSVIVWSCLSMSAGSEPVNENERPSSLPGCGPVNENDLSRSGSGLVNENDKAAPAGQMFMWWARRMAASHTLRTCAPVWESFQEGIVSHFLPCWRRASSRSKFPASQ